MYRSALANPATLFIGIDANPAPLRKISIKAERKLARLETPNAIYVQASAEELPEELQGVASDIHINFPWGSLLRATLLPDTRFLKSLRALIRREGGSLSIITGIDPVRDRAELDRLGMPLPDVGYLTERLVPAYSDNGFLFDGKVDLSVAEVRSVGTTWARKLASGGSRSVFRLRFSAAPIRQ